MARKKKRKAPGALTLVEQSINLLRRDNSAALAEYYLGTLPFVLALLYFCSDMSRNPMAPLYCGPFAAGVALTFIWMKLWHVRYCRRLWCHLLKSAPEQWSLKRHVATAVRQSALHAAGALVLPLLLSFLFLVPSTEVYAFILSAAGMLLPLSLFLVVPFGWAFAFFQTACVVDDAEPKGVLGLARAAKRQAFAWPLQNIVMLLFLVPFGFVVFINLGLGFFIIPYLLKSLLGVETVFTLGGIGAGKMTYLAVTFGLTYLCVDPIVKAAYVLRAFIGRSVQTGDDLKAALHPYLKIGLILMIILLVTPSCWARVTGPVPNDPWDLVHDRQDYVGQLDEEIESVLEHRRFAWRIPRQELPEDQGWIRSTFKWIGDRTRNIFRNIGEWLKEMLDGLFDFGPDFDSDMSLDPPTGDYRQVTRLVFFSMIVGLALWLITWIVRWLKAHRSETATIKNSVRDHEDVDLEDESITAEDLPRDRWLAMAREMVEGKEYRKAVRALYLSVLASLADGHRVMIAPYKSNREYSLELARRAHAEPELLDIFNWCIGAFERSWYGTHPVGQPLLDQFMDRQERLAALVQPNI